MVFFVLHNIYKKGKLWKKGGICLIALIVDKDMDSRIRLKHLIQENAEECCVLEFPDGRQAMDYVSVPGREADFLFTEVELKGMSGFTLCRNMKKLQNQCYLIKPFDGNRIKAILKDALRKKKINWRNTYEKDKNSYNGYLWYPVAAAGSLQLTKRK